MATATFDKRIVIDQKDAEFLVTELDKTPIGPPMIELSFMTENEKEVDKWLSNFGKQ
jgi:hypothetical protein